LGCLENESSSFPPALVCREFLRETKPVDLPVEQPTKFELLISR
jgi:hypothetical protein